MRPSFQLRGNGSRFLWLAVLVGFNTMAMPWPVSAAALRQQSGLTMEDLSSGQYPVIPSGPGLVVCEPVVRQADTATGDFGAGCGRWLEFEMGRYPDLDQSPSWHELNRAHIELTSRDLRLPWPQAGQLGPLFGLTHVAVGEITGNAARCTLTYQLYSLSSRKTVGSALKATGTDRQILDQLPEMAHKLVGLLNVKSGPAPARIDLTPEEMRLIGRYIWFQGDPIPKEDVHRMYLLGRRLPLAGLFYLRKSGHDMEEPTPATLNRLMTQAPDNMHLLGEMIPISPGLLEPYKASFEKTAQRYPHNYLFHVYTLIQQYNRHDLKARLKTAALMVRCAPRNPTAWGFLAKALADAGESVRRSKFYQNMTPKEAAFVARSYPLWFQAAQRATQLDPQYGFGWKELATAATFAGQPTIADTAFWKATTLLKNDPDLYWWGLQMYQPKWLGDPDKLARVARLAMEQHFPTGGQTRYVAKGMAGAGLQQQSQTLYARALDQDREAVRANPGDAAAHHRLADALREQGRSQEAMGEYETTVRLTPNDAEAHYQLGGLYYLANRQDPAILQSREAIRLNPKDSRAHRVLGLALLVKNSHSEAEKELREALRLDPNLYDARYGLGNLLSQKEQWDSAIVELKRAVLLDPRAGAPHRDLCYDYTHKGQMQEAIKEGETAISLIPRDPSAYLNLGNAYSANKEAEKAYAQFRKGLQLDPNSLTLHFYYGNSLNTFGRRAEARAEWNRVLTLAPNGEEAKEARQQLDKYP